MNERQENIRRFNEEVHAQIERIEDVLDRFDALVARHPEIEWEGGE